MLILVVIYNKYSEYGILFIGDNRWYSGGVLFVLVSLFVNHGFVGCRMVVNIFQKMFCIHGQ